MNALTSLHEPVHDPVLVVADLAQIEARALVWAGGQWDVVDAFKRYDAAVLAGASKEVVDALDIYTVNGAKMAMDRQGGKIGTLACGYQAGRYTVCAFAKNYGMNLTEDQGQAVVTAWREANPMVVQLWKDEEDAAKSAIENPGVPQDRGKLGAYLFNGRHLLRKLPSGRCICYRNATVELRPTPWGQNRRVVVYDANYFRKGTREFVRLKAYGGLFVENLIQAMCRDILAVGIYRAERAGLHVILHVHDEIGVRSTNPAVDGVILRRAMTAPIKWCLDLQIASSVDVLPRYRKT